jgi:hypothetical protein
MVDTVSRGEYEAVSTLPGMFRQVIVEHAA